MASCTIIPPSVQRLLLGVFDKCGPDCSDAPAAVSVQHHVHSFLSEGLGRMRCFSISLETGILWDALTT